MVSYLKRLRETQGLRELPVLSAVGHAVRPRGRKGQARGGDRTCFGDTESPAVLGRGQVASQGVSACRAAGGTWGRVNSDPKKQAPNQTILKQLSKPARQLYAPVCGIVSAVMVVAPRAAGESWQSCPGGSGTPQGRIMTGTHGEGPGLSPKADLTFVHRACRLRQFSPPADEGKISFFKTIFLLFKNIHRGFVFPWEFPFLGSHELCTLVVVAGH